MVGQMANSGLSIETMPEGKIVTWAGEGGSRFRAVFALDQGQPVGRSLGFAQGQEWAIMAQDLRPEFEIKTGVRRGLVNQPHEERWWNYSDKPLTHPEEVRTADAVFACEWIDSRIDGARAEITFPGVTVGQFAGALRFTAYQGANLLRVELVAMTAEDSVAYMYRAGLSGLEATEFLWMEPQGNWRRHAMDTGIDPGPVRVRARNRVLTVRLGAGSMACFPPPHAFFWDRQRENNVGFNYYRRDGERVAIGVRHNQESEYPLGQPNPRPWELYNARPGTQQRMSAFFYLSPEGPDACRQGAMAYTRGDVYKRLPGYATMVAHFHMAFWEAYRDSESGEFPWIKLYKGNYSQCVAIPITI